MDQIIDWVNNNKLLLFGLILIISILYLSWYMADKIPGFDNTEKFKNFTPFGTEKLTDGYYVIRGSRNKRYCSDDANGLICTRDFAGPKEVFNVIGLGKGKYSIQSASSGLWCSLTTTGIFCTSPIVSDWEVFRIRFLGGREYSIQSNRNNKFCMASGHGFVCDVPSMYGWEFQKFEFIPVDWPNIK